MPKPRTPSPAILALPRRNRRALFLLAHREDHSVSWEPYRRWDGGAPNIVRGFDALKAKAERKAMDKGMSGLMSILARGIRGTTAHRLFRRKTA